MRRVFRKPTRRELGFLQVLATTGSRLTDDTLGRIIVEAIGQVVPKKIASSLCRGHWVYGGVGLPMFNDENGRISQLGRDELKEAGR